MGNDECSTDEYCDQFNQTTLGKCLPINKDNPDQPIEVNQPTKDIPTNDVQIIDHTEQEPLIKDIQIINHTKDDRVDHNQIDDDLIVPLEVVMGVMGGNIPCEYDRECPDNAHCQAHNKTIGYCECNDRYLGDNCQTYQKSQLVAFLLALFLGGLGVGRCYMGYYLLGVLKGIFFVIGTGSGKVAQEYGTTPLACWCLFYIGWLVWWIVDLVFIGNYTMLDFANYPLFRDM